MGVDGQGGRSGNGGRVGLVGLLLLFTLMLLSKVAIIGFVDSPRHMVLAPIKGIFPDFLPFLALPRLGRLFLPTSSFFCSRLFDVFFLFFFFKNLMSPFLSPAMALSLGSSLSWPFRELISAAIATIFSSLGDFAPQFPCLEEVKLAFGHGHHGLVSETGEIPIEVLIVLGADVLREVVAWYQEIGFKEDANGVVEGGPSRK